MPLSAESFRTDGASGASDGRRFWRRGGAAAAAGGFGGSSLGGAPAAGLRRHRTFVDLTEQRADGDRLAVLGGDLAEHSGGRRRHFDGDLVGFELDQRLVHRHGIAGLLEPAANGGFRHGLAECRNTNFSHVFFLMPCAVIVSTVIATDRRAIQYAGRSEF